MSTSQVKRILITTGDADGIGTEVTMKALQRLGPKKGFQFVLMRTPQTPPAHLKILGKKFKRITFQTLSSALESEDKKAGSLLEVVSNVLPHECVSQAATACVAGKATAIATAPMSKKSIAGRTVGHTEILKDVSKSPHVFMAFLGKKFNVVTCTGHIPIKDVAAQLTADKMMRACVFANAFNQKLSAKFRRLPLGIVGLNPHAGENGSIGLEELSVYSSLRRELDLRQISYDGPLVPDAAFSSDNWARYSFYISPYHDQALIPFKVVHGKTSGAHLTLGLPFVRTSVDHGTAKDIFNKNKADSGSMLDALKWAIRLSAGE